MPPTRPLTEKTDRPYGEGHLDEGTTWNNDAAILENGTRVGMSVKFSPEVSLFTGACLSQRRHHGNKTAPLLKNIEQQRQVLLVPRSILLPTEMTNAPPKGVGWIPPKTTRKVTSSNTETKCPTLLVDLNGPVKKSKQTQKPASRRMKGMISAYASASRALRDSGRCDGDDTACCRGSHAQCQSGRHRRFPGADTSVGARACLRELETMIDADLKRAATCHEQTRQERLAYLRTMCTVSIKD